MTFVGRATDDITLGKRNPRFPVERQDTGSVIRIRISEDQADLHLHLLFAFLQDTKGGFRHFRKTREVGRDLVAFAMIEEQLHHVLGTNGFRAT